MGGRPRKPSAIKKAQGTFAPSRSAKNEMMPSKVDGLPSPPEVLQKNARAMRLWSQSVQELSDLEMLHHVDLPQLAAYCLKMATFFEMEAFLQKNGRIYWTDKGDPKRRPEDIIAKDALEQANKIAQQFGFAPSARTRISMPEKAKDEDDKFFK